MRPRGETRRSRAQTSFDFVVGMAVFLLAVGFVLVLSGGVLDPFGGDTGGDMVVSDRAAATLAGSLLVERTTEPGVLNATCTAEFFDADGTVADCRFDVDGSDPSDALGVGEGVTVNVTIEAEDRVAAAGGVDLAVGRDLPASTDYVVARRVVLIDGLRRTMFVRVW